MKKTTKTAKKTKKKNKNLTLREALRITVRTIKVGWKIDKLNYSSRYLFTTLEVVLTLLSTYVGSRILGELVNSVNIGNATPNLYKLALAEALILLAINFSSSISTLSDRIMFIKWDKWFTLEINKTRANLDIEFYEDRENQKLLNKIDQKGTWAIEQASNQALYIYSNLLKIVLILGSVLVLGPWVIIAIALASIPRILTEIKRSKLEWGIWATKGDEFHAHQKTINLFRDHKNLIEIKLYNLRDKLLVNFAGKNITKFGESQAKAAKSTVGIESVAHVVYEGTFLGVTLLLLKKAVEGTISIANFSFYAGVLNQFSSAMRNVSSIVSRASESILYSKDVYSVMDSASKISTPTNAAKLNPKKIPTIEFKNVSFAYKSNPKEKILENLNLTIKAGEHLALVGENGAGKTTIIKLLLRLYDVTEGQILVNGIDIKELDLDSYWSQIGVLFQEFNRYPFDIKTNIEFGRAEAKSTKQKITRAEELSNLDPVLKKLPRGINTILDNSFEEGVEPSGGQWQRVALARAFYRDSNILILDEPTAAVDANAKYEIFNNIFNHYGNKTALIISHRFSTVKRAQRIVVLQKGKIVEEGSHRELMKNSKLYSEMFTKQAEGYKD